ncbi:MAG: hypothetical protein JRS35_26600 [Deltaproteobacteria bacterium]|nr:hypothetical protein [Deltaproteobacteria bacterium]
MSRLTLFSRLAILSTCLTAALALLLVWCGAAHALIIGNGLDCTNPGNVIDDLTYQYTWVDVRDFPPNPTEVCLVDGGRVGAPPPSEDLSVYDNSIITMSGGMVSHDLFGWEFSTITVSGGTILGALRAHDSSNITVSGGDVAQLWLHHSSTLTVSGGKLDFLLMAQSVSATVSGGDVLQMYAYESSTMTIVGSSFEVDGVPVPYGGLVATIGTLTGTLASGDPISAGFSQGGEESCEPDCTGTITLAPGLEAVPSLSPTGVALLGGLVFGIAVGGLAVQRRSGALGARRPTHRSSRPPGPEAS